MVNNESEKLRKASLELISESTRKKDPLVKFFNLAIGVIGLAASALPPGKVTIECTYNECNADGTPNSSLINHSSSDKNNRA